MAGYSVLHSPLLGEEKVVMRPRRTGGDISRVSLVRLRNGDICSNFLATLSHSFLLNII